MTFLVTSLVEHAELLFQIDIHRCSFWFGVRSRRFISAFGAIGITPQFDVQSRIPVLVFRAVIISQLDVHSHLADFDIETPPPIYDSCFRWIVESLTPWAKSSQRT